ncbi:hypothetical protein [Actinacidiphila oryziradicis]|uniref:Uncharacterized protein n=1 Tax=Actinacidiphila oryziradicis TaxID=2571141 RepID=A0A4U0SJF8_9ACTN|nr:hypothetical protein [Actinacidiphila oryziradicis]TKA09752.1 hypothetical protein FCI23_20305 [Actinacidiphila oryziradicis]
MAADRLDLPPVRLLPEDELARQALAAPLLQRAVLLARWAAPHVQVDAMGELAEADLRRAAAELGLEDEPDGLPDTAQAWGVAVDSGLVELEVDESAAEAAGLDEPAGQAAPGEALTQLDGGRPQDVLEVWLAAVETALAEAASPDLEGLLDDLGPDGEVDQDATGWDPEEEAEFLDGALGNLYLFSALEENETGTVPLPVLAASMVVPEEMEDPTDAVLEEVTEVMMRLDEHFRLLISTGLIDYEPVDEALIEEEDLEDDEAATTMQQLDPDEVSRYGLVRLTPLGVYGVRARMIETGVHAPASGDLADQPATELLEALFDYPDHAARREADQWLAARKPADAARELLHAARGDDRNAPARRLVAQQTLSLLGGEAEGALREVLEDRQLGGLARVWLAERDATDVPPPDEEMVFWLTIDTLAAQLDADDDAELLEELVTDLVARHDGFFSTAWRVDHPATADVLEAMGRLHPDKQLAKEARKAAFKARSANSV